MTEKILIVVHDGEINRVYAQSRGFDVEIIDLDHPLATDETPSGQLATKKDALRDVAARLWNDGFVPVYIKKYQPDDMRWTDLLI